MACVNTVKTKQCKRKTKFTTINDVMDIEDLIQEGTAHNVCPFKGAVSRARKANVVLVPYSTLFHAAQGLNNSVRVADKVVIIDEAHNMFNKGCSAKSGLIDRDDLKECHVAVRLNHCHYRLANN